MSPAAVQRPGGFRPEEISALINDEVVEQHAEEAAFLWTQRERAVVAPNFRLKDLTRLDERVNAHLDGLRIAGAFGWRLCDRALLEPDAGVVFAATVLAFESRVDDRIQAVLKAAVPHALLERALVSGLGWLAFDTIQRFVQNLAVSAEPASRALALAACAIHRRDPGQLLVEALSDVHPRLRGRALKACGELGKTALQQSVVRSLSTRDSVCRFFAAWSAARLGDRSSEVLVALREAALSQHGYSERALGMALRIMQTQEGFAWQRQLRAHRTTWRLAARAVGILGDPSLVEDLIELMKVPPVARPAGAAFALLTGIDLAYDDLDGEPPSSFEAGPSEEAEDENVQMDPDASLAWPVPEKIAAWWTKNGGKFVPGKRYLLGREINEVSLGEALIKGSQPQRAAAALELGLRQPSQPLFEVRSQGGRQLKHLAAWKF